MKWRKPVVGWRRRLLRWLWKTGHVQCLGCRNWGTACFHGMDSLPCPIAELIEEPR